MSIGVLDCNCDKCGNHLFEDAEIICRPCYDDLEKENDAFKKTIESMTSQREKP